MKVIIFPVFIFLTFLWFSYGRNTVEFRARKIETLTIFAFDKNGGDENVAFYIYYLAQLISLWNVNESIVDYSNLPMELFFGKYNATNLLQAADAENNTAAMIVLKNNDEFIINITDEINISEIKSTTKCNKSIFCKIIHTFLKTPRDPLTKLNFIFVSNIFPNLSFFKDFFNFGSPNLSYKTTKTYLISNAISSNKKLNNPYLHHQFIPKFCDDFSLKSDTEMLADPRFGKFCFV